MRLFFVFLAVILFTSTIYSFRCKPPKKQYNGRCYYPDEVKRKRAADQAKRKRTIRRKMLADKKECREAEESDSKESWQKYLEESPEGRCVEKALARINFFNEKEEEAARREKERKRKKAEEQKRRRIEKKYGVLVEKTPRYLIRKRMNDLVLMDRETKLIWQRTVSNDKINYDDAKSFCEDLVYAGYDNWKLPQKHQLKSLTVKSGFEWNSDSWIYEGGYFWSNSQSKSYGDGAWGVCFKDGYTTYFYEKKLINVICVIDKN